ncbi:putative metalloprotease CJM1_0395 family protein [Colwellia sp. 12G3]|uniref:putative metalloprotease CJM1_0395 family protein n=1 Tax=Colwellia sp. 12G3 TaxID=2058299 RepID=UPI000C347EC3|nr:putative metalloprotease CJM1_0395 family protein [Colwellia sp. 12G3]PKI16463.1 hypothetical protein CXF71_09665 [Colwellia sp. 12G3]
MNITPHTASLPLATVVNPPTEGLRRENNQREIITQVTAANPSAAEKGVASDKERARTPAQVNEEVDFANLRKQAEHAASSISEQGEQQGEQSSQQNSEEQQKQTKDSNSENDKAEKKSKQAHADERVINQLQQRDKEVRTHELAHATAGGAATGSPSYTFEIGPDGKKYAVGGEVAVDLSTIAGDPQATIIKMQKVHAAALAPASPSAQDTRVAASAAQQILTAQSDLLALKSDKANQSSPANNNFQTKSTFNDDSYHDTSNEFDTLMNQTLSAQDAIISSSSNQKLASSTDTMQSTEVLQRANRIESFYFNVSQGYEKPDNFQFELTA